MDFDKEFSDFKNRESEQLAKFGEGARIYRILGEIEMKRGFAKYFYEAGQQSKQEEVNKLQGQIDALKTKVNDALEAFNDGAFNYCQKQLEEILK